MALLMIEGWEGYDSVTDMTNVWLWAPDGTSNFALTTGRHLGTCFRLGSSARLATPLGTTASELYAGFSWKFGTTPSVTREIFGFQLEAQTYNGYRVSLNNTGYLQLIPKGVTQPYATGTTQLTADTWYYLELYIKRGDSDGEFTVKINGTNELALTSIDTQHSTDADYESIELRGDPNYFYFDDMYVCDTTGSVNTGFLGMQVVELLRPNGAGNYAQWTPSAGSNYTCVNETTADDDTSYVGTTATSKKDSYDHTNITQTATSVAGVKVITHAKCTSGDFTTFKHMVRSSTSDEEGDPVHIEDSYMTRCSKVFETDPNTSSAWTKSGVDADEFGVST